MHIIECAGAVLSCCYGSPQDGILEENGPEIFSILADLKTSEQVVKARLKLFLWSSRPRQSMEI